MKKTIWNKFSIALFVLCWIFIGGVAAIDTGLTVHLRSVLKETEQNPMARVILARDGWEVSKFIGLKMFGTILVLGIVTCLYKRDAKHGLIIIGGIAMFQALLLLYLLL